MSFTHLFPPRVLPGARLSLHGRELPVVESALTAIALGGVPARVAFASTTRIVVEVPDGLPGGPTSVTADWHSDAALTVEVGRRLATGLHQVDSPVFDAKGRLYVTYSGARGQDVPISIFRVTPSGAREPLVAGLDHPTSLAVGPDGTLYVSSRFEGIVYRVFEDGRFETVVNDVGVACGLAFGRDRALYVGDRSGTVFRVHGGRVSRFATLPSSIAAFHLAMGPDDRLYVAGPTLAPRDPIHRIDPDGRVETLDITFGRPQGLAFAPDGTLHIVEALAGEAAIHRWREGQRPEPVVTGPGLIGLAFDAHGGMAAATRDSVYRF